MTAPPLPATMRAWTYTRRGAPSAILTLSPNFPTPAPPTGSNLLIRISHSALNPGTLVILAMGLNPLLLRRDRKNAISGCIPELDFSGTVHLAGPGAPERFQRMGTRVFGTIPVQAWETVRSGVGTLAEFAVVGAGDVAVVPEGVGMGMEMAEAAGLSACGQTAVKMCEVAGVKAGRGQRVLVNGGSGGLGTLVCQIVRTMGAGVVVATCSGGNVEMVRGLGVDEVIDYRAVEPLPNYLATTYSERPFDVILDTVGIQALYEQSPAYLKPNGVYINVGAFEGVLWTLWCWTKNTIWPSFLGGTPRRYAMFSTVPNGQSAEKLAEMVEEGKLKVVVDSVFKMEDVLEAYDRLASRRARGKIIIKIQDD